MRAIFAAASALALAGCASITRGTSEQIQFDSLPTGAEVRSTILPVCDAECAERNYGDQVSARQPDAPRPGPSCTTPCVATVSRNDVLLVNFTKPGFDPQSVKITPQVAKTGAMGFAGNIIAGGVTGMVIDAASGATLDHCPNPVFATLRKTGSREPFVPMDMQCKPPPVAEPAAMSERSDAQ